MTFLTPAFPLPLLFRLPKDGQPPPAGRSMPEQVPEAEQKEDPGIFCKQCLQKVTHPDERIDINGAHMHVFTNAYGIVFEIGCFRTVWGCRHIGPPTDEWTWFGGYNWQITACGQCGIHLGWRYTSEASPAFHGLILDHLIRPS
jgi:hypothetical protein